MVVRAIPVSVAATWQHVMEEKIHPQNIGGYWREKKLKRTSSTYGDVSKNLVANGFPTLKKYNVYYGF